MDFYELGFNPPVIIDGVNRIWTLSGVNSHKYKHGDQELPGRELENPIIPLMPLSDNLLSGNILISALGLYVGESSRRDDFDSCLRAGEAMSTLNVDDTYAIVRLPRRQSWL